MVNTFLLIPIFASLFFLSINTEFFKSFSLNARIKDITAPLHNHLLRKSQPERCNQARPLLIFFSYIGRRFVKFYFNVSYFILMCVMVFFFCVDAFPSCKSMPSRYDLLFTSMRLMSHKTIVVSRDTWKKFIDRILALLLRKYFLHLFFCTIFVHYYTI